MCRLQIAIGNPSYQITGMPPLTDSPFATVGNDWSLPHTLLNERHLAEFRDIAEKDRRKNERERLERPIWHRRHL